MKVAVIGAGWAGLTAAITLHRQGHSVHVFEAAHQPGGRARTVHSPGNNPPLVLDNGQHILLGAYRETLSLMRWLDRWPDELLLRLPLTLERADGTTRFRAPAWPAPFHALAALLGAHGPSLKERVSGALPLLRPPKGTVRKTVKNADQSNGISHPHDTPETVAQWLKRCGQSQTMIRTLWEPLCLAALNTPLDQACALLFYQVLQDSLTGSASNSHLLIPCTDLGNLWPDAAVEQLRSNPANRLRFGHTVRHISVSATQTDHGTTQGNHRRITATVDDETFDAIIVATSVPSARRLLGTLPCISSEQQHYLQGLEAFTFLPIATLTLHLEQPWQEPCAMLMLEEDRQRKHFGQWVFNQRVLNPQWPDRVTVVISDANDMTQSNEDEAVAAIIEQIRRQTGKREYPLPAVKDYTLITEKRATFAAVPGLWRPDNRSPWPGVWLAGDYTDTGYPAVLEGAVRSGLAAAKGVNKG